MTMVMILTPKKELVPAKVGRKKSGAAQAEPAAPAAAGAVAAREKTEG
jgi:hypothetical protein